MKIMKVKLQMLVKVFPERLVVKQRKNLRQI